MTLVVVTAFDVTLTLIVQVPFDLMPDEMVAAGTVRPVGNVIDDPPGVKDIAPTPPHVVDAAGIGATTKSVGIISTRSRVSVASVVALLVSVIVNVEVPGVGAFGEKLVGANAFASVTQPQSRACRLEDRRRSSAVR